MDALQELKIKAKKLQDRAQAGNAKALKRLRLTVDDSDSLKLAHCLDAVAQAIGFAHWTAALQALTGADQFQQGTFWYDRRCYTLLSKWVADYDEACEVHKDGGFLLPYKNQFIIADDDFIRALGLSPQDEAWSALHNNVVAGHGASAWQWLIWQRFRALTL